MAEPVESPVEALFSLPPRRRSHLKSQTYLNLVKIVSLCYGDSPLASAPPIIPLDLIQDKGNNQEGQTTVEDMEHRNVVCVNDKQPGILVVPDSRQPENLSSPIDIAIDENLQDANFLDRQFRSTQVTVNEIEKMMQTEENRDDLNQNEVAVHESSEHTGLQGRDYGLEKMLMNELETIMKGNEGHGRDESAILSASSLDENHCVNFVAATSMTNQEEDISHQQPIMTECVSVSVCNGGQEDFLQKRTESSDCFSDIILSADVSKSDGTVERRPLPKTVEIEERHTNQQKEMECEKSFHSCAVEVLPGNMVEDEEIEEGEISGEYGTESIDRLSENNVVSEQANLNEMQLNVGQLNGISSKNQNKANIHDYESTSFTTSAVDNEIRVSEVEQRREGNGANHGLDPVVALPNHLTLHGDKEVITSQEKDADTGDKKKRSCSNERKKWKRERDRKKRAMENQKLGVKRLKLQTVLTPKTIRICQHYLVGRCYEGENCKFSHDAVPLTKSTPCSYFARNTCMKGDGCPFDHELSKYPCTNYMSKGFCSRGDNCLFSHKMLPPGEAPSSLNGSRSGQQASLPGDSCSKKKVNAGSTKIQRVAGISHPLAALTQKSTEQGVAQTHALPPSHSEKPASCVTAAISLVRGSLPSKRSINTTLGNQTNECTSGTVRAVNESPKPTPSMAPRGINFLSFGKAASKDSCGKKTVDLPLNLDGHNKESRNVDGVARTSNHADESNKERELNQMLVKTQPFIPPTGINFLPSGKAVTSFLGNHREVSSTSTSQCDKGQSSQENRHVLSLHWRASPLASSQSSKLLEHKNSPSSMRKALMSTLDFAAKFDISKNRSTIQNQPSASDNRQNSSLFSQNTPASPLESTPNSAQKTLTPPLACAATVNSEVKTSQTKVNPFSVRSDVTGRTGDTIVTGRLGNESADASNFMEFLSSFSSKRKW